MTSLAELVQLLFIDYEVGISPEVDGDWEIFVSYLPDNRDKVIVAYDTAGSLDGRVMSGERIIHPGVQVRIVGEDYSTTYQKAQDVALAFDTFQNERIATSSTEAWLIRSFTRTSDVLPLGMEEGGDRRRYHFTVNAIATVVNEEGYSPFAS